MSLDLVKAKLQQFPTGTEFHLALSGQDGEEDAFRLITIFAAQHGLILR